MRASLVVLGGTLIASILVAQDAPVADSVPLPQVHISIAARRLWVLGTGGDTLFTAPVAVGSGKTLVAGNRTWTFRTPRGLTAVRAKEVAPLWIPPDWHYVELGRKLGLRVRHLAYGQTVRLKGGDVLAIQSGFVGIIGRDSVFRALPADEEVIFGGVLYVPPFGTENRKVAGTLGPYRLLLANGVGLHGTTVKESIGHAVTHGCIRLHDADITWLYENIPIATPVRIY